MVKEIKWKRARKKPCVIEFREVREPGEKIFTREGELLAFPNRDYIIKGVKGELYPIKKDIFNETYEVIETPARFCKWQVACKDDFDINGNQITWTCTAHLHEARAFICRYSSLKEARNKGCQDAKKPVDEDVESKPSDAS